MINDVRSVKKQTATESPFNGANFAPIIILKLNKFKLGLGTTVSKPESFYTSMSFQIKDMMHIGLEYSYKSDKLNVDTNPTTRLNRIAFHSSLEKEVNHSVDLYIKGNIGASFINVASNSISSPTYGAACGILYSVSNHINVSIEAGFVKLHNAFNIDLRSIGSTSSQMIQSAQGFNGKLILSFVF